MIYTRSQMNNDTELTVNFTICREADVATADPPTAKPHRWVIAGYAATGDVATDDAIITKEALERAAKDLLERSTVLLNHDTSTPIGRVLEARVQQREGTSDWGLWVKVLITATRADVWQLIQEGVLNKFSIRGRIQESTEQFDVKLNKTIRYISSIKLMEVSIVSVPADASAAILSWSVERKAKGGDSSMPDEPKVIPVTTPPPAQPPVPSPMEEVTRKLLENDAALTTAINALTKTVNDVAERQAKFTLPTMLQRAEVEDAMRQNLAEVVALCKEILAAVKGSAEEKKPPSAPPFPPKEQPMRSSFLTPVRKAALSEITAAEAIADVPEPVKVLLRGAMDYLSRTLVDAELKRETDDPASFATSCDEMVKRTVEVLETARANDSLTGNASISVEKALEMLGSKKPAKVTPPSDALIQKGMDELKTELAALRTAMDQVQVIKGAGNKTPDNTPKRLTETEEWKRMSPQEKAQIVGAFLEKNMQKT